MATRRTTFGKLERERQKREKAAAKRERRAALQSDDEDEAAPAEPTPDEGAVLNALAEVHRRFDEGELDLEEFEARRDELRAKLTV